VFGGAIVGGILSWVWLRIAGRRTIYLCGLILHFVLLMITGGVGTMMEQQSTSWALGSLIILLTFIYDTTIGPTCYVLVAETPSSHLRIKTVVLARIAYSLSSLVVNVLTTHMLNPTAWHWGGKSSFFFAGTTVCCFVWAYFRLPEPKGLTYLELDLLFSRKAPARKFRQFRVRLEEAGYFSLARVDNHPDNIWDPHRS
jgi:SP family general alpha glucoside:H+ symporter-like MFS transporter